MPVKCQVIIDELDRIAPRYLAESWDNVGLIVGSPDQNISIIMVTLDITEDVVDRAMLANVNMIVSHHPLIFKGIKAIRTDLPQGRLIAKLIRHDIAVYAAHTNLDIANGGINDILAEKLGLVDVGLISSSYSSKLLKLVVFIPKDQAEKVRDAICQAGAGHIGNYSNCTFSTGGTGTFLPLSGTNPFIGHEGTLEQVPEVRLETIMPEGISSRVIKEMIKAHPYEEVAYDLYPLANEGVKYGLGRVGYLPAPMSLCELALLIKQSLGIELVKVAGAANDVVRKIAVCGGSGACLIKSAAFSGADVLVTGDVKYHEAQEAIAAGIAIIDAGHFATENIMVEHFGQRLQEIISKGKLGIEVITDKISNDIFWSS